MTAYGPFAAIRTLGSTLSEHSRPRVFPPGILSRRTPEPLPTRTSRAAPSARRPCRRRGARVGQGGGCGRGSGADSRARFRAERLVFVVVGAQRVAVGEDGFFAEQVEHDRVVDELSAARLREGGPEKEVAVAVHHEDARAAAGAFGKGRDDLRVEGIPDVVVARPVLEQVAEDVEIPGPDGALAEKLEKDLVDPRPAAREVKVGDEKDRHSPPMRPPPSR